MGKPEWGGNPVFWWLGLYFCFVCCLDEASCTVCYWWLGDARSCIQVVSFVWVWYSLGLVLSEKEMATHSSVLTWRIPGTEPCRRPSMGSHRVRRDWSDLAAAAAPFLMVQLSHPYMTPGKTTALTIWIFVCKVMSVLFNTLARFCQRFSFKEQESFIFLAGVTICRDFGAQENKICHCFHCFPIYLTWSDGTGGHDLCFWNVEF